MLRMSSITKEFAGTVALFNVEISVDAGQVHGLIGENGAGKSTLMKILSGVYPHGTYAGQIMLNDAECRFSSTGDAANAGIAMIHQELELVPQLSVEENISLGAELSRNGVIDRAASARRARAAMDQVGLADLPLDRLVGDLSLGKQQLVEIAKALARDKRLLILDEPTTSLSKAEADHLLALLRQLVAEGRSCIFISHRLDELLGVADQITVLRDGRYVGTYDSKDATANKLVSLMVGRSLDSLYPPRTAKIGDPLIEVENWSVEDPERSPQLRLSGISLVARAGEVVSIAGLVGAGRTEFALSLIGLYPGKVISGTLRIEGKACSFSAPAEATDAGLGYLSEDRKRLGLFISESIGRNVSSSSPSLISRFGVLDPAQEHKLAADAIAKLGVKCTGPEQVVGTLSGGNQQKVAIAKVLANNPKVLILDEPTRGVDVGARYEIYRIVNELATAGNCVLMISSDLPEVLGMSDRVVVFSEGRLSGTLDRESATEESVMRLAVPMSETAH